MDPASPSRLVPGAWPASPSPPQRRCNSIGSPHFRQHIPNLSPHKITPRRVTHSYFTSKYTADNTPTTFASDLSLQPSLANTSVSSAYMSSFFEHSPLRTDTGKLPHHQNEIGRRQSLSTERRIRTYCDSPSPPGDQTFLSLPEIPDLSSTSSLQDDSCATSDIFNVSANEPSYLTFDENMQTPSLACGSIDTLSSSSVRFRPTAVPRLEGNSQALQLPQCNDRNSGTLFLSPVSGPPGERSSLPLHLTWTPRDERMSELEYHGTVPAHTNVRRSWVVGNNLPGPIDRFPEEEASTQRYANEVLDHAFRMDADGSMFTLSVPGVSISPDIPPLKVVSNPQRRVKFSHVAKRFVHRIFNKPRMEGKISEHAASEDPKPFRNSRHCRYPPETEEFKPQVRDSSVLLRGGTLGSSSQDTQGGPELRVTEFNLGGIKVRKRTPVSSPPNIHIHYPITPSLQHLSALVGERPKVHRATSENQHFLHCDILKIERPKGNHRQSFLHRIGV